MDSCGATNYNKYILGGLAELVSWRILVEVSCDYMVISHFKFALDILFTQLATI